MKKRNFRLLISMVCLSEVIDIFYFSSKLKDSKIDLKAKDKKNLQNRLLKWILKIPIIQRIDLKGWKIILLKGYITFMKRKRVKRVWKVNKYMGGVDTTTSFNYVPNVYEEQIYSFCIASFDNVVKFPCTIYIHYEK